MNFALALSAVLLFAWLATYRFRIALVIYVGLVAAGLNCLAILPGVSVIKLLFPVLILGYLVSCVIDRRPLRLDRDLLLLLSGLIAVALVGLARAGDAGSAISAVSVVAGPMALALIIAGACRSLMKVRSLASGIVFFACLTAALAVSQGTDIPILRPLASLTTAPAILAYGRAMGAFNNPNFLGASLSIAIPLCAVLFALERRPARRIVLASALVVFAVALVLTHSRSSWVGVIVGLPFLLLARRLRARLVVPLLLVAISVALVFAMIVPDSSLHERARGLNPGAATTVSSFAIRLALWQKAIALARDHPLVGVGLGNFGSEVFAGQYRWVAGLTSHNVFLAALAETGLLGLALFTALVLTALRNMITGIRSRGDPKLSALSWGFLVAFVSLMAGHGMASGSLRSELMWALVGTSFAIRSVAQRAISEARGVVRSKPPVPEGAYLGRARC